MHRHRRVWIALLAAPLGFELWTLSGENRLPFTGFTEWAFSTHTPRGRWAFAISWTALWLWFLRHVLRRRRAS